MGVSDGISGEEGRPVYRHFFFRGFRSDEGIVLPEIERQSYGGQMVVSGRVY